VDRAKEPSADAAVTTHEFLAREVVAVMSGFEQARVEGPVDGGEPGSTVSVEQAARLEGIGRTLAYRLAAADQLPVPVLRIGRSLRIPVVPLLALLGLTRQPEQRTNRGETAPGSGSGQASSYDR
jgi:hypothetical protein